MPLAQQAVAELSAAAEYFNRSTRNLTEAHSTFKPAPDMMSAAQQVAHAAQTIDWFVQGAFRPEGFDVNFEEHMKELEKCVSLEAARAWFQKAIDTAKGMVASKSDEE